MSSKEYYQKNRKRILAYQAAYRKEHREQRLTTQKKYRETHKVERAEYGKRKYAERRTRALAAYGNKCACCGEKEKAFLCIDHIDGNGNQHRLEVRGSKKGSILRWLEARNYPPGFRVLCHNCNMARGIQGYCPHEGN